MTSLDASGSQVGTVAVRNVSLLVLDTKRTYAWTIEVREQVARQRPVPYCRMMSEEASSVE